MKKIPFVILVLSMSLSSLMALHGPGHGYHVGDVATDFELMNVDKTMVSMADYPDALGYIVIFTCNHCPYSKMYEDRIIELHNKYAEAGFPVIAINPNDPEVQPADSFEKMQVRAKEKGFEFPYLFDDGQKVFPVYGATRTPHVFVLDAKKVVKYIGAIDDSPRDEESVEATFVEDAVEAIRNGKDPDPSFTKAVGCSIKTKRKS
jgi:peroxiredoxin